MRRRNRAISYFGIACGNCNCYLLTVQRLFPSALRAWPALPLSFWVQSSRSQLSSILASVRSRFAPPQLTHSRCWWGCCFPGISCPVLLGPVLPHRVDSSRDHCCSEWVSTSHVCVDGRCSRGAWARSLLVGCSVVWKEINQNTARTELVSRVRAHSRRQRCFPGCLVSASSLSQSLTRDQNAY